MADEKINKEMASSYPAGGSYGELLTWHLCVWGTRPKQGLTRGKEWDLKDFAKRVHEGDGTDPDSWDDSLINWITGVHKPKTVNRRGRIETELFGTNRKLMPWRDDLRAVYRRVYANKEPAAILANNLDTTTSVGVEISADVAANIVELVAIARKAGVFERAADRGIPEAAVRNIVERLGGEAVASIDLIAWLEGWIEAVTRQLSRQNNEGSAFALARAEAQRRFRAGHISDISQPIMDLLATEKFESTRRQILLIEEAIRFDVMSLDTEKIELKLISLVSLESLQDHGEIGRYLLSRADNYTKIGLEQGDRISLLMSLYFRRCGINKLVFNSASPGFLEFQENLDAALVNIWKNDDGKERISEAKNEFRMLWEQLTNNIIPFEDAMDSTPIGRLLYALEKRELGAMRLEEAIPAYDDILKQLLSDGSVLQYLEKRKT